MSANDSTPAVSLREVRQREAEQREHDHGCATTLPVCSNLCPPSHKGRWRDWHRGHGCQFDPDRPKPACTCRIVAARRATDEALVRAVLRHAGQWVDSDWSLLADEEIAAVLDAVEREEA